MACSRSKPPDPCYFHSACPLSRHDHNLLALSRAARSATGMRVHETSACNMYNPSPRPVTLHDEPPMLAAARHIVSTSLACRQVSMSEERS